MLTIDNRSGMRPPLTSGQHRTPYWRPAVAFRPLQPAPGLRPPAMRPRPQPLKHMRYPLPLMEAKEDVTTCIAARVVGNTSALIFCMDMKGSVEWSSSETTYKWIPFGNFHALISGPTSVAKELARYCAEPLRALDVVNTQEDVTRALGQGLGKYKRAFAESRIQAALGISYDEFRKTGKSSLPEDLYRDLSWEIKNHKSKAELIFAGFLPFDKAAGRNATYLTSRRPYLFKVTDDDIITCDDFACIGSGAGLAEASLMHRQQTIHHSVPVTIYHCYEAKRMSERAEGVGEKTRIVVVYRDSECSGEEMKTAGLIALAESFTKYSPQIVPNNLPMDKDRFIKVY